MFAIHRQVALLEFLFRVSQIVFTAFITRKTQLAITCSKLTIETREQCDTCLILTIKVTERGHKPLTIFLKSSILDVTSFWFIVNFKQISRISLALMLAENNVLKILTFLSITY